MALTLKTICELPENFFKPSCNCINPPQSIRNAANNMLAPYYCWYAPCLVSNAIKTPEIIQGQLDCKIKNCSITIDEINISGGIVNIENRCAYDLANAFQLRNVNVNLERITFTTQLPVFRYSLMLAMIAASMFLSEC